MKGMLYNCMWIKCKHVGHVEVQECGLSVHQEYQFLGATPNRVV